MLVVSPEFVDQLRPSFFQQEAGEKLLVLAIDLFLLLGKVEMGTKYSFITISNFIYL
jgi:hypothetical protein